MKKNQIALMCLTVIIMLAVWFIKSPLIKQKEGGTAEPASSIPSRLVQITNMRDAIREERALEVASLNEIIADSESTVVQKKQAIADKEQLSDLTEQEVLMELAIINLGYTDAFVHQTNNGIEVLVVSDELTALEVVDITNLIYASFAVSNQVVVYNKTLSEITSA